MPGSSPLAPSPMLSFEPGFAEDDHLAPVVEYHPYMNGNYLLPFKTIFTNICLQAKPCDEHGIPLDPKMPPVIQT